MKSIRGTCKSNGKGKRKIQNFREFPFDNGSLEEKEGVWKITKSSMFIKWEEHAVV
jgi:hypothetical protein